MTQLVESNASLDEESKVDTNTDQEQDTSKSSVLFRCNVDVGQIVQDARDQVGTRQYVEFLDWQLCLGEEEGGEEGGAWG